MKRLDVESPEYHQFEIIEYETGELCWHDEAKAEIDRREVVIEGLVSALESISNAHLRYVQPSLHGYIVMTAKSAIAKAKGE